MILCVDPDTDALAATADALADAGFDTRRCGSVDAAREVLRGEVSPDAVVTEYDLPDGTGLDVLRSAREEVPDAVCVLFTETPLDAVDTAAFGDVVADYLSKNSSNANTELAELIEHGLAFGSQTAYPLPEDEEARLAALGRYAVDEAGLEAALDRLTELATALFDVDSAAIGLVDAHHERFISCHGISLDDIDREDTVCTYAIIEDEVTVIEDLTTDPRFSDNEALLNTSIRFYAGTPVTTDDGQAIGTFCVYDDSPRTFSDRDRHLLTLLGDEAMDQLELRRRYRETGEPEDE